ncbi:unnamed protein product [Amoebophrya sp. A25]|nr:unnamed protein product [Amoebophrya sp. A25]|eukprot:GSA25T00026907001.1
MQREEQQRRMMEDTLRAQERNMSLAMEQQKRQMEQQRQEMERDFARKLELEKLRMEKEVRERLRREQKEAADNVVGAAPLAPAKRVGVKEVAADDSDLIARLELTPEQENHNAAGRRNSSSAARGFQLAPNNGGFPPATQYNSYSQSRSSGSSDKISPLKAPGVSGGSNTTYYSGINHFENSTTTPVKQTIADKVARSTPGGGAALELASGVKMYVGEDILRDDFDVPVGVKRVDAGKNSVATARTSTSSSTINSTESLPGARAENLQANLLHADLTQAARKAANLSSGVAGDQHASGERRVQLVDSGLMSPSGATSSSGAPVPARSSAPPFVAAPGVSTGMTTTGTAPPLSGGQQNQKNSVLPLLSVTNPFRFAPSLQQHIQQGGAAPDPRQQQHLAQMHGVSSGTTYAANYYKLPNEQVDSGTGASSTGVNWQSGMIDFDAHARQRRKSAGSAPTNPFAMPPGEVAVGPAEVERVAVDGRRRNSSKEEKQGAGVGGGLKQAEASRSSVEAKSNDERPGKLSVVVTSKEKAPVSTSSSNAGGDLNPGSAGLGNSEENGSSSSSAGPSSTAHAPKGKVYAGSAQSLFPQPKKKRVGTSGSSGAGGTGALKGMFRNGIEEHGPGKEPATGEEPPPESPDEIRYQQELLRATEASLASMSSLERFRHDVKRVAISQAEKRELVRAKYPKDMERLGALGFAEEQAAWALMQTEDLDEAVSLICDSKRSSFDL